jgi:FMN phosphatase YigB (HAD superfamily)
MSDKPSDRLVFLFDVDNTLLDNDHVKADMRAALLKLLGTKGVDRFWELYEQVRKELDVVSWPETIKRFADSWEDKDIAQKAADLINNWPFADYLYPGTLPTLKYVSSLGEVGILSDGDEDYQPRKIANAGLTDAVGGPADVLIYTHKDRCFEDVMRRLPGRQYVLVEDKEPLLAAAERFMGWHVTTVWVRQGHYAHDPKYYEKPDPDITVDSIGDMMKLTRDDFLEPRDRKLQSERKDAR